MKAEGMASRETLLNIIRKTRNRLFDCAIEIGPPDTVLRVKSAIADPLFPVTFLLRNLMALEMEHRWQQLALPAHRSILLKLLAERSLIFCEVLDWLRLRGEVPEPGTASLHRAEKPDESLTYCNHCGGCCEIASGLAVFPEKIDVPSKWQQIFAEGLGPNHRFCAFLWEDNGQGLSLCAIHQWRPNPCRLFAVEECRHLMSDPSFAPFLDHSQLIAASSRLCGLLDGG